MFFWAKSAKREKVHFRSTRAKIIHQIALFWKVNEQTTRSTSTNWTQPGKASLQKKVSLSIQGDATQLKNQPVRWLIAQTVASHGNGKMNSTEGARQPWNPVYCLLLLMLHGVVLGVIEKQAWVRL